MAAKRTKTKKTKSVSTSASTTVSRLSVSGGGNPDKKEATVHPVRLETELLDPWDREIDLENGYRGLSVAVIEREDNVITFTILNESVGGEYSINLDDGLVVWGSLPSTAQRVDVESSQRIGYLFVTPDWMTNNGVTLAELPKWPRITSL
jgi:hypothetical protein